MAHNTNEQQSMSINWEEYDAQPEHYYLGYRGADYKRPFAKYFSENVSPISNETLNGLVCSPWASALGYEAIEAKQYLLRPGYLPLENGFTITDNGTAMIAVRTDIGQTTGEAFDWWFGWHSIDSARYKLWHPQAHQYSWRSPNTLDCSQKSYAERYIGTFSFVNEFVGNKSAQLTVAFIDPFELGIDKSQWSENGIEAMVCAQISAAGHITTGFHPMSYLIHQVRLLPDGNRELRSRFWLPGMSGEFLHDLVVHCSTEMKHLSTFLPQLFEEFKDCL